jgi:hypothetical protein
MANFPPKLCHKLEENIYRTNTSFIKYCDIKIGLISLQNMPNSPLTLYGLYDIPRTKYHQKLCASNTRDILIVVPDTGVNIIIILDNEFFPKVS